MFGLVQLKVHQQPYTPYSAHTYEPGEYPYRYLQFIRRV